MAGPRGPRILFSEENPLPSPFGFVLDVPVAPPVPHVTGGGGGRERVFPGVACARRVYERHSACKDAHYRFPGTDR